VGRRANVFSIKRVSPNFIDVKNALQHPDPDVIMIEEMRSKETASIAIEASLTGHLVLSTLNTSHQ
jgi:type II secretory ATPase GspE/PulE/Tfp pilus assembly ATPase PilB-like protein